MQLLKWIFFINEVMVALVTLTVFVYVQLFRFCADKSFFQNTSDMQLLCISGIPTAVVRAGLKPP